ncbi:unnamed protein product [Arctogadus glacialis]
MTKPGLGRQDLFWSCDKFTLRLTLPAQWSGTCIIVRLLMPVTLFTRGLPGPNNQTTSRHRRDTALTDHFDLTKNTPTYIRVHQKTQFLNFDMAGC